MSTHLDFFPYFLCTSLLLPCALTEHTHKDVEKKVSCEVKEFAHSEISTVIKIGD